MSNDEDAESDREARAREAALEARRREALDRYLEAADQLFRSTIFAIFGALPDWLPEPKRDEILRAVALMEGAGLPLATIPTFVIRAEEGNLGEFPDTVKDPALAATCASELAHIKWALSLREKADALRELGGSRAARDFERSKRGNDAQRDAQRSKRLPRNEEIRASAVNLRKQNSRLTDNAIAQRLAEQFKLSTKQVRRILKEK